MRYFLWIIFGACLGSCRTYPANVTGHLYVQKEGRADKKWTLVWEDNFNSPELDTSKWTKIPPNKADWGRHMSSHPDCFALKDGKIFLRGINNPDTLSDPRPFLTGGIYTKGKFAFQYGRIEIHAKLEGAQGAWPAMWMLAETDRYGKYPKNGEIDIMEHLNHDSLIYQTTHSWYTLELKQTKNPPHGGTARMDPGIFNTFGLEWYPDKLVFTLNGKETFRYPRVQGVDPSQWPYDQPFYVLIDQQLGGNWVGKVDTKQLPVQMVVDWVRVYQ
ncbi:glycoside hydrolase family 16 protein [Chitinophaga sp.]|uniref:glycoside hydrolase family 16 protein n=1 Tax=Chitinophaga sp. TaxID=1869181 RepID=UPI0031DE3648